MRACVPFGVTVRDLIGTAPPAFRLPCMNDESVVFGLCAANNVKPPTGCMRSGRRPILTGGTLIGAGVGKLLPAPETVGLDAYSGNLTGAGGSRRFKTAPH